jgi:hypothetical protein
MSLTGALIVIPGVCYALASLIYLYQKQWPMAIVYWHYAGANAGLYWLDRIMAK